MPEFHMLSEFKSLIDQERPLGQLFAILKKGTVHHAFLFTGLDGVGKKSCALMFAMAGNCLEIHGKDSDDSTSDDVQATKVPCGRCRSCRKILSGNHPDIIQVKPSGSFIKIDQVRDLCRTLTLKPHEAVNRVVIMESAGAMNPEAGNALLKVLEEPPDKTTLILTSDETSDLLPTIVSRCQHIRFNPISISRLKTYLIEECGVDDDLAMKAAQMANGSLSKAMLMKKATWIKRRHWLITEVASLSSKSFSMVLSFAERLSNKKDVLSDSLEIIKMFLRDIIIFQYDPERIINRDMKDTISKISRETGVSLLIDRFNAVQAAQKKIEANGNVRLILEILVLKLARNYS